MQLFNTEKGPTSPGKSLSINTMINACMHGASVSLLMIGAVSSRSVNTKEKQTTEEFVSKRTEMKMIPL